MDWFKKHTDTVIVIGAIISSMIWMNSKFNGVDSQFAKLEKDIAIMKTVLIMKGIAGPEVFAAKEEIKK